MDIQEAIKNLESTFEQKSVLSGETMKMAISALQELVEREKGCEDCCGEIEVDTPFCPMCGKRLK